MADGGRGSGRRSQKKVVLFDVSKRETHHPNSKFRKLARRLRSLCRVQLNKGDITVKALSECDAIVFGCPRERFSTEEFEALRDFVGRGGSICVLVCEGGEKALGTNVNSLLREHGISVENDCVVRTSYHKYFHPKNVFISSGVVHPDIYDQLEAMTSPLGATDGRTGHGSGSALSKDAESPDPSFPFVYPNGATLCIKNPSVTVLSSGPASFPLDRAIVGVCEAEANSDLGTPNGRVVVSGSSDMFSDEWIEKEENGKLSDIMFKFLLHESTSSFDRIRCTADVDFEERICVPDIEALSGRPMISLEVEDALPQDCTQLFTDKLFKHDTHLIPEAVKMYEHLKVKHEPLSIPVPHFSCPIPPLRPAVFIPHMRDSQSPPPLEQFDLDAHFANDKERLAQLTNKCRDEDDIDYFVTEVGDIMGWCGDKSSENDADGKRILYYTFRTLVELKMTQ